MRAKVLKICCGAHAVHDGFTDLINVLLPLLQAHFSLTYAASGALKMLYSAAMAIGQIPSSNLAARIGAPVVLSCGTALAGLGYIIAGLSGLLAVVAFGLVVAGLGASTQHPIASSLVSTAFEGKSARPALGTYNAAGDVGKVLLPALFAIFVTRMQWQTALMITGTVGLAGGVLIYISLSQTQRATSSASKEQIDGHCRDIPWAFRTLFGIHLLDNVVRTGYQVYLPFLLIERGASLPQVGMALSLLFAGGAGGKFIFGWIGARIGVVPAVAITAVCTSTLILLSTLADLALPQLLVLLPLLGVVLAGSSSVLNGTIPEFVPASRRTRAFAIFYTGGSVAGALSPPALGLIGDHVSLVAAFVVMASLSLVMAPLTATLRRVLDKTDEPEVTGRAA